MIVLVLSLGFIFSVVALHSEFFSFGWKGGWIGLIWEQLLLRLLGSFLEGWRVEVFGIERDCIISV